MGGPPSVAPKPDPRAQGLLRQMKIKTVRMHLSPADIRFWSPATRRRATAASTCDVWTGDHSIAANRAPFDVVTTAVRS
jgi:hypothetical protein